MRRKSIGATSQAFHEPMSTGAFLEFLTGLRGPDLGPGPAAEMLERRRGTPPLMGYPGFVSLQVPTSEAAVSGSHQEFAKNRHMGKGARRLVTRAPSPRGPGPKLLWRPGPQAPGAWIPPLSPVDFLQAEFLTSCCVSNPCTITPNPLTLGGVGWFPKATVPPTPPHFGQGRKEEGFHPLRLRQPSNTPPKVGG